MGRVNGVQCKKYILIIQYSKLNEEICIKSSDFMFEIAYFQDRIFVHRVVQCQVRKLPIGIRKLPTRRKLPFIPSPQLHAYFNQPLVELLLTMERVGRWVGWLRSHNSPREDKHKTRFYLQVHALPLFYTHTDEFYKNSFFTTPGLKLTCFVSTVKVFR